MGEHTTAVGTVVARSRLVVVVALVRHGARCDGNTMMAVGLSGVGKLSDGK